MQHSRERMQSRDSWSRPFFVSCEKEETTMSCCWLLFSSLPCNLDGSEGIFICLTNFCFRQGTSPTPHTEREKTVLCMMCPSLGRQLPRSWAGSSCMVATVVVFSGRGTELREADISEVSRDSGFPRVSFRFMCRSWVGIWNWMGIWNWVAGYRCLVFLPHTSLVFSLLLVCMVIETRGAGWSGCSDDIEEKKTAAHCQALNMMDCWGSDTSK